jgi:hypothetical protein
MEIIWKNNHSTRRADQEGREFGEVVQHMQCIRRMFNSNAIMFVG